MTRPDAPATPLALSRREGTVANDDAAPSGRSTADRARDLLHRPEAVEHGERLVAELLARPLDVDVDVAAVEDIATRQVEPRHADGQDRVELVTRYCEHEAPDARPVLASSAHRTA